MNCLSCQKEIPTRLGYVSNSYRFCQHCFTHIIEKRVRKYIKEHHPLRRGQRVLVSDKVSAYFAQHVLHVPVIVLQSTTKKPESKILLETLDDVVVAYLEHLLSGKKMKQYAKRNILLFSSVTDEELARYCQHHKLPFNPQKHPLKQFLVRLEQEHPGTIHSLYKSTEDLKEIL